MNAHPLIERLMMPVEEFAVVDSRASVHDALAALAEAQRRVPAGRQSHRSVLVRDRAGRIVGKVGQRVMLRALLPETRAVFDRNLLRQAGISEEMVDISLHNLELLNQDMAEISRRATHYKVRDLVLHDPERIELNAPLSRVIRRFVENDILSLLVVEGDTVVGVLRMTDLFDDLSAQLLGGESADGS